MTTYSIFGAGAAGLYTAWRLLDGTAKNAPAKRKLLDEGDTLELYDWGRYDFSRRHSGSREPGARVCTWHFRDDKSQSFLELGGMRYSHWNGVDDADSAGHRVVTTVIDQLGLDKYSVPFNVSNDPLYYLRTRRLAWPPNHVQSDKRPEPGRVRPCRALAITGRTSRFLARLRSTGKGEP